MSHGWELKVVAIGQGVSNLPAHERRRRRIKRTFDHQAGDVAHDRIFLTQVWSGASPGFTR